MPATFKNFVAGSTSLKGRTDSSNSAVAYQIYRSTASGLEACGSAVSVSSGAQLSWQTGAASLGADPANCTFQPGESILFRINLQAHADANAYVSTLNFAFSSQ